MAKKKNKKNLLKAQLQKLKQEQLDVMQGKKTKEQIEHDKTYGQLKEEEKMTEHKFYNGSSLSDNDIKSLTTPMNARYVKAHSVACANRMNMLLEGAHKKIRLSEAHQKHITALTEQLKKKKQPNKLMRIIKKWKEI